MTSHYSLTGAAIVAGDDLSLIKRGYVTVADGIVTEVGEGEPSGDAMRIDATGRVLVPAFINCHTHLGDAILKERAYGRHAGTNLLWAPGGLRFSWMDEYSREARVAAMQGAIQQMLATGTVAFADFRENGVDGVRELREACAGTPVTGIIFARFGGEPAQSQQELVDNTAHLTPERVRELDACLEVADGFSPVWANELTDPALAEVQERVRAAGKRLATHAIETPNYRDLSVQRTGRPDVVRVLDVIKPDFVVHMTDANRGELGLVSAAGVPLVFCPRGQAALGNGFSPLASAMEAGIPLALGSDNAMLNSPDLLKEMDFLARVAPAVARDPGIVQPRDLLAAATIGGARALGLHGTMGSISAGKSANVIIFDGTAPNLANSSDIVASLVLSATQADIKAVLVDGVAAYGSLN